MDFVSNKAPQHKEMLKEIGVERFEDLLAGIPHDVLCETPSEDDGLSEYETIRFMEELSNKNTFQHYTSYLGAGAYDHHVPSVVSSICSRGEFLTSYTPYQPEVSQGMLQAIFEYQSSICALTGMDVANASLYDGASACAEACLLAIRSRKKGKKLYIAASLHPNYRKVIEQYIQYQEIELIEIPYTDEGLLDLSSVLHTIDDSIIGVLVQSPNFFGNIEDLKPFFSKVKEYGGLSILCSDLLSYGIFSSAAELGADIAVGDSQSFGLPLNFGGAYAGYIACKKPYMRQMPGRIVGETVDLEGRRGFVITLQAREQHIRREKATSNICTNQALAALSSLIAISWYGKQGVYDLALTNFQRCSYLKEELMKIKGITVVNPQCTFNEFIVKFSAPIKNVIEIFNENSIIPGLHLGTYFSEYENCLLIAVTETKQKKELDKFLEVARGIH